MLEGKLPLVTSLPKCGLIHTSTHDLPFQLREPPGRSNWLLVLFLAAYCLLFTVVYLVFKDPYIHEVNDNERGGGRERSALVPPS